MTLVKMLIQSFEDSKFTKKGTSSYTVFLNPESFSHTYSIEYTDSVVPGNNGKAPKYKALKEDQVSFDLMLDGTMGFDGKPPIDVATSIHSLQQVVLNYQGKIHEPYYVQLSWSDLLFNCRLTKFDTSYTLFKPDGSPLRAKVSLAFKGFTDPALMAKRANRQSSDLTHHYRVQAGDTLPALCYRIYGKPDYYLQVAQRNNLVNFRRLEPGSMLVFPPLV